MRLHYMGAEGPKPLTCAMQQILGDRDVNQGGVQVTMTKVGPEVRQLSLDIDAFLVPLDHPMYDKTVSQIVDSRTGTTGIRLEAGAAHHSAHQVVGSDVGVATLLMPEQRAFSICGSKRLASGQQVAA